MKLTGCRLLLLMLLQLGTARAKPEKNSSKGESGGAKLQPAIPNDEAPQPIIRDSRGANFQGYNSPVPTTPIQHGLEVAKPSTTYNAPSAAQTNRAPDNGLENTISTILNELTGGAIGTIIGGSFPHIPSGSNVNFFTAIDPIETQSRPKPHNTIIKRPQEEQIHAFIAIAPNPITNGHQALSTGGQTAPIKHVEQPSSLYSTPLSNVQIPSFGIHEETSNSGFNNGVLPIFPGGADVNGQTLVSPVPLSNSVHAGFITNSFTGGEKVTSGFSSAAPITGSDTPTIPANAGFVPASQATVGFSFGDPASAGFAPAVSPTAGFAHAVSHTAGFAPAVSPTAGFAPPVSPTAGFAPPVSPTAGFAPPVPPTAGFAPPVSATVGFAPPVSANAGFAPPVSANAGFAPPVSANAGFAPPVSANAGFVPGFSSTAGFAPADTAVPGFTAGVSTTAEFAPSVHATTSFAPLAPTAVGISPPAPDTTGFVSPDSATAGIFQNAAPTAQFVPAGAGISITDDKGGFAPTGTVAHSPINSFGIAVPSTVQIPQTVFQSNQAPSFTVPQSIITSDFIGSSVTPTPDLTFRGEVGVGSALESPVSNAGHSVTSDFNTQEQFPTSVGGAGFGSSGFQVPLPAATGVTPAPGPFESTQFFNFGGLGNGFNEPNQPASISSSLNPGSNLADGQGNLVGSTPGNFDNGFGAHGSGAGETGSFGGFGAHGSGAGETGSFGGFGAHGSGAGETGSFGGFGAHGSGAGETGSFGGFGAGGSGSSSFDSGLASIGAANFNQNPTTNFGNQVSGVSLFDTGSQGNFAGPTVASHNLDSGIGATGSGPLIGSEGFNNLIKRDIPGRVKPKDSE